MKQNILLIGFGTVGQGLCEIIQEKSHFLKQKYDYEPVVTGVCDPRFGTVYCADGLDTQLLITQAHEGTKFTENLQKWDAVELIRNAEADVVCELAFTNLNDGEPAITHCRAAFETRKHVVTSNKGPAALAYREMMQLAAANGVQFLIEGTVMSGSPVLNLADGPLAGCTITSAKGILNGTTNYMLSEMEKGMDYDEVLKTAQELGYAEADPAGDVEGYDARAKVTILTNVVMGENFSIDDVSCEGITGITAEDIRRAKSENARWKLIGSVEKTEGKVTAAVKPEMVPLTHPLAGVMGAANALTFHTDLLGDVTVVGPGAGRQETGYSILTDLIALHRGHS